MEHEFTHLSQHRRIPLVHRLREAAWFVAEHTPKRVFGPCRFCVKEQAAATDSWAVTATATSPAEAAREDGPPSTMRATWVGHATTLLDCAAQRILIDPVWSKRLAGWVHRLQPPGVAWNDLGPIAAVLVSHDHADHMDKPTLRRLDRSTPVIVPIGVGRWFRRNGFTDVRELAWWESTWVGDVHIEMTGAHHGAAPRWGKVRRLWGGFLITHAGLTAYHAGDTAYGDVFEAIGSRQAVDLAILPIGAYAPREVNGLVHMDPEEALRAFCDLGARAFLPVHWGTFRLSPEPVGEPMERLLEAWAASGLDASRLVRIPVGGHRDVRPRVALLPKRHPTPLVKAIKADDESSLWQDALPTEWTGPSPAYATSFA